MRGDMLSVRQLYRLLGFPRDDFEKTDENSMECCEAPQMNGERDQIKLSSLQMKTKPPMKRQDNGIGLDEHLPDEERAKRKAERRRAKKKRQRERRKLEKGKSNEDNEQEDEDSDSNEEMEETVKVQNAAELTEGGKKMSPLLGVFGNGNTTLTPSTVDEEPEWDVSSAFVANAASHIKPKSKAKMDKRSKENKENQAKSHEVIALDPFILKSRQLAEHGIDLAKQGSYSQAVELFTEAVQFDPKDHRSQISLDLIEWQNKLKTLSGLLLFVCCRVPNDLKSVAFQDFDPALVVWHSCQLQVMCGPCTPECLAATQLHGKVLRRLFAGFTMGKKTLPALELEWMVQSLKGAPAKKEATLLPATPKYFGNRSYCYDRLQKYNLALEDAETSIRLAADWPKGYFRKGRALLGIKRYAEAESAFEVVLQLDKDCDDAVNELFKIRILRLMNMGFTQQQSLMALRQHRSVEAALDSYVVLQFQETNLGTLEMPEEDDHLFLIDFPIVEDQSELPCASLWVGNVTVHVKEKQLKDLFRNYGEIDSIRVLHKRFCAFVNFKCHVAAAKALEALQGKEIGNTKLLIRYPDRHKNKSSCPLQSLPVPERVSPQPKVVAVACGSKRKGPVDGDGCYFWRTTGCHFGDKCRYKHIPEHRGVDKKPWQH